MCIRDRNIVLTPIFFLAEASARKKIGVRTIFNVVGPLANPAKPDYQIIGTSNKDLNEAMIQVLQNKGLKQAMVVTSKDGIDELSITDVTHVHELRNNQITTYDIDPREFGLSIYPLKDIQVNTSEEAYLYGVCLLYTSPSPRDLSTSRMPSSA